MIQINASDIEEMPVGERIRLVEDLWNSIAKQHEAIEVPELHKDELEKREKAYHINPKEGTPWTDVKKRILG